MKSLVRPGIVALFTLVAAPAIAGPTLYTPLLSVSINETVDCMVSNLGTSPIEVTVGAFDSNGNELVGIPFCPSPPATLAAGTSCRVILDTGVNARCSFASKGKIRAAVRSTVVGGAVLAGFPATAK